MNIHALPDDLHAFGQFNTSYEREHFRSSESNQRVGMVTIDLLLGWYLPLPLRRLGARHVCTDGRSFAASVWVPEAA